MTRKGFEILAEITATKYRGFWQMGFWGAVAEYFNGVGTLLVVQGITV